LNAHPRAIRGTLVRSSGRAAMLASAAARPRTHLSVHGTAHPMSAASVRPRSAADCFIRSAVDISHPRQQGNPPASSSAASGPVRSDTINGLGTDTVGRGGNPSLFSSMSTGVVPGLVDSASAPPSLGRGNYLPTQSQASYHSASPSPSARRPSSGFDVDNEDVDVHANVSVADGHDGIRASALIPDDNDDDADTAISMTFSAKSLALHPGAQLLLTLISLLATSTPTSTSLALHFSLHSLPSPPLPSAAAGEPI